MPVSGWHHGKVRVVVLDRPDRANAIDLETAEALAATFDELEHDDDTRVVLLTGAGERAFSAGNGEGAGWQLDGELPAAATGSDDAAEGARAASEKREPARSGR